MTDAVITFRKEIETEIKNFETNKGENEAKNPRDLQKEIELYIEKRGALVEDYNKKHQAILDAWKQQNERIKERWNIIKCITSYAHSVGHIKHVIDCQNAIAQEIRTQQDKLYGKTPPPSPLLVSLEEAKKKHEAARQRYKTLAIIGQAISTRLVDIDKWVQQIDELIPGENQNFAIYIFWCKVIPAHRDLGEALNASCSFIDKFEKRWLYIPPSVPRTVPWLIPPGTYLNELNDAFLEAFQTTRQTEVDARIAFDNAKAKLDSLVKAQKEWADKTDEKVKSALQEKHECPVEIPRNDCTLPPSDQIP